MKVTSIQKRSWKPHMDPDTGKWYTGYEYGEYNKPKPIQINQAHEVRTLTITPVHTTRGRSAANMIFEDKTGYKYIMGLSGGFELIKRLIRDDIKRDGEYLIADFVQTKRGSNIFIEAVEYE